MLSSFHQLHAEERLGPKYPRTSKRRQPTAARTDAIRMTLDTPGIWIQNAVTGHEVDLYTRTVLLFPTYKLLLFVDIAYTVYDCTGYT